MPKRKRNKESFDEKPDKKLAMTNRWGFPSPAFFIDIAANAVADTIISIENYFNTSTKERRILKEKMNGVADVLMKEILSKLDNDAKKYYTLHPNLRFELLELIQDNLGEPLHNQFDDNAAGKEIVHENIQKILENEEMLNESIDAVVVDWKCQFFSYFSKMPNEVLQLITNNLDAADMENLALVSSQFYKLIFPERRKLIFSSVSMESDMVYPLRFSLATSMQAYYAGLTESLLEEAQYICDNCSYSKFVPENLKKGATLLKEPFNIEKINEINRLLDEYNHNVIKNSIKNRSSKTTMRLSLAVAQLDLKKQGLTRLPKSLFEDINLAQYWQKLEWLELDNNRITELPSWIGNLRALNLLSMGGNRLSALPTEIGNLHALKTLGLDSNRITELPASIANLRLLQWLTLDNNQLIVFSADAIANPQALDILELGNNHLTEAELVRASERLGLGAEWVNETLQTQTQLAIEASHPSPRP